MRRRKPTAIAVEASTVGRLFTHAYVGIDTLTQERVAVLSTSAAPTRIAYSSQWFPIPKDIDAAEAAVVFATYLPALRILRYNPPSNPTRIGIASNATTPLTAALARLARVDIGVYAAWTTTTKFSSSVNWVIDFCGYPHTTEQHQRLICCRSLVSFWDDMYERSKLTFVPHAALYDLKDTSPARVDEIHLLLDLLQRRRIRPEIQRLVSLREMMTVSTQQQEGTTGVVVCEPWKA